ncbi:type VII secretion system-associated protein [Streptomyces sp. NPDC102283]|uniref:type VII secretion system-associated protein n=1 Tax=Streptomyces sp. NPDC102283 TaxID=3366155 RepID=UPI00381D6FD3
MNDSTAAGPTATGDDAAPPVPEEIREAARLAPDHWLGMVDPAWAGEGDPPEWAVVGRWRSGLDGDIEEWQPNEAYRPSPQALGWPAPTDPVDEAVQLSATGYGPGEAVPRALATAEVAVLLAPGGVPLSAVSPDGTAVVPVFSSPVHLHAAGRFGYELAPVTEVMERLPEGHLLYVNPSGPVGMTVETDALRRAVDEAAGATPEDPRRSTEAGADDPESSATEADGPDSSPATPLPNPAEETGREASARSES